MFKKKYLILTFLVNKEHKICSYLKCVKISPKEFGELAESMRAECKKHFMKCVIYDLNCEINFHCDYIHIYNHR